LKELKEGRNRRQEGVEGRKELDEGRKEGRKVGRKESRKERRKEGRKEGGREGRKEGRNSLKEEGGSIFFGPEGV
jgi:hypothetical protein